MSEQIGSSIVTEYGLLGLMILAVGYMVWELLKERRRSESRMDEIHATYMAEVRAIHEKYSDLTQANYNEYRQELRQIGAEYRDSIDRISKSVNNLTDRVETMLGDVADLKKQVFNGSSPS